MFKGFSVCVALLLLFAGALFSEEATILSSSVDTTDSASIRSPETVGLTLGTGSENVAVRNKLMVGSTADPSYTLDVHGYLRVNSTSHPGRDYRIQCGSRQDIYANNDLVEHVNGNKCVITGIGGGNDQFQVAGLAEDTKILVVDGTDQRVGIGTTSPDALLDVEGGAIRSTESSGEYGEFERTSGANPYLNINLVSSAPANRYINFQHGGSTKMTIRDDGNVGIGTTSPGQKLDVNGNIEVNNRIYDNNNDWSVGGSGENLEFREPEDSDKLWAYIQDDHGLHLDGAPNLYLKGTIYDDDDGDVNIGENLYVSGSGTFNGILDMNGNQITDMSCDGGSNDAATCGWISSNYYRRQSNSASVTAGRWYRIASNSGNRANAEFTLRDFISGGGHSTLTFRVGISFNYEGGISFTLLNHNYYSTPTFTKVRILEKGTYDPQYLEVYVQRSGSVEYSIYDNYQSSGWSPVDWAAGSIPSGYTAREFDVNKLFVVGDYDDRFTINRGGNVGIGTTSPKAKLDVNGYIVMRTTVVKNHGFEAGNYSYWTKTNGCLSPGVVQSNKYAAEGDYAFGAEGSGTYSGSNALIWAIEQDVPNVHVITEASRLRFYTYGTNHCTYAHWHVVLTYTDGTTTTICSYITYGAGIPSDRVQLYEIELYAKGASLGKTVSKIRIEFRKDHSGYARYKPTIFIDAISLYYE